MKKRILFFGLGFLAVTALAIVACTPPGTGSSTFTSPITTSPFVPREDVTFTFEFGGPAAPNQPIPITITVNSRSVLRDVQALFTVLGPSVDRNDPPRSLGDRAANEPKQITTTLILPHAAVYFIHIYVFTPEGFHASDSINIRLNEEGISARPTSAYGPGTPATAAPPEPPITPQPTSTLVSFSGSGRHAFIMAGILARP